MEKVVEDIRELIERIYKSESRRVLATLIRMLGDFDLAEDAMHDAFGSAIEQWPDEGVPENPRAWLVSAGRFKAIDRLRRRSRFETPLDPLTEQLVADDNGEIDLDAAEIEDDRLRLIFTCCHPALTEEAQVALTLREICGLTTEEIARAFLSHPAAIAQRIVRAKRKIREARIPYCVPARHELPGRLEGVLQVLYLIFNEGYSASSGKSVTRVDLSEEAIRLGRLLTELLPEPEVFGLFALMLLHESRRSARTTPAGDIVLLEDQDRSSWNREMIDEGINLVYRAFSSGRIGSYTLQAAIAAEHARSTSAAETNWSRIVGLYSFLMKLEPSPVVELNRAVAIAMRDGPMEGLKLIDSILAHGNLADYHLAHSARAELCSRLGRIDEARSSFESALALVRLEPERRLLEGKLKRLDPNK